MVVIIRQQITTAHYHQITLLSAKMLTEINEIAIFFRKKVIVATFKTVKKKKTILAFTKDARKQLK